MTNSKIKLNLDSLKSRKEWVRHKVKDGSNIFRILPPFGEASNGYPYRKWQIIWGLADPETGRARPFASSMTSERKCPVVEYIDQLKVKAEAITGQLRSSGASDEDVKERLKGLNQLISDLSPRTVYIYNAADKGGVVGLLELKATAHRDMKEKMNKYIQDYNQDPTSLNSADDDSGVWFDVQRSNATGKFFDTKYAVEKVQMKVRNAAGKVSFEDDRSPLPDNIVENYENLAYDLSTIYQQKTYDELKEVLNANLAHFVELCPDANLGTTAPAAPVAKPAVKQGAGKITARLDDEDDQDAGESANASNGASSTRASGSAAKASGAAAQAGDSSLDSFMAEAENILNS